MYHIKFKSKISYLGEKISILPWQMAEQLAVEVDVKNVTEHTAAAAAAVQSRTSSFILFGFLETSGKIKFNEDDDNNHNHRHEPQEDGEPPPSVGRFLTTIFHLIPKVLYIFGKLFPTIEKKVDPQSG